MKIDLNERDNNTESNRYADRFLERHSITELMSPELKFFWHVKFTYSQRIFDKIFDKFFTISSTDEERTAYLKQVIEEINLESQKFVGELNK